MDGDAVNESNEKYIGMKAEEPNAKKTVILHMVKTKGKPSGGSQNNVPRGMPKSGRPWKLQKKKFSDIKKSIKREPISKKMEFKNEMRHIKEVSRILKEERRNENQQKKRNREMNAARRLQNELKSQVVQIVKNPAKINRMRKSRLQKIDHSNIPVT